MQKTAKNKFSYMKMAIFNDLQILKVHLNPNIKAHIHAFKNQK